jgi:hypothetical protein
MKRSSLVLVLAAIACAQEPATAKKPDGKLAADIKKFNECLQDKKFARDAEAVTILDQSLHQAYEAATDKDKAEIVKALAKVWEAKQRPPDQKALYNATAATLGRMGKEGGKVLVKTYEGGKFKDKEWISLRADMLRNLGKCKDEANIKFLTERARRDIDDPIMAAAGEALGNYEGSSQAVRKEIVKELLIKYGEVHGGSKKNLDPGDLEVARFKATLQAISEPWNTALGRLTGQNFREADEWRDWWNKNKAEDWDKNKPKPKEPSKMRRPSPR